MNITGHADKRELLKKLVSEDKLPGTILFAGTEGIGKKLLAKELSKTILCNSEDKIQNYGGCNNCEMCKLFDAENLPDFYEVESRDKKTWDVENFRTLLNKLSLKSFSAKSRVVIINDAEYLSTIVSNVLLKSLEEPRKNLFFVLVSASPSRLPPTLLSRCQTWHFSDLSKEEVETIAKDHSFFTDEIDGNLQQEIIDAADGSMKNIVAIANNFQEWKEISQILKAIIGGESQYIQQFVKKFAKDKEELPTTLFLMQNIARNCLITEEDSRRKILWGNLLHNISLAHYYIFDRIISQKYLLSQILISAIDDNTLNEDINFIDKVMV